MSLRSISYIEIDVPYCTLIYGVTPCRASLAMAAADAPQLVNFDGTTTYLTRGGTLTGAADSKLVTGSFWIRITALPVATSRIFAATVSAAGADFRFRVNVMTDGVVQIIGTNAANSAILDIRTTALEVGRHYHVLFSFDLSNAAKRHIYVNDVSNMAVITFTNDTLDLTLGDWSIGALPDSTTKLAMDIGELWLKLGVYIDMSITGNRRLFISAAKQPVPLGSTGQTPTGSSPTIFLSGDIDAWHTNKGTGGGFTKHGLLGATPSEVGFIKCFNSLATCQDHAHFTDSPVTLRFNVQCDYWPQDLLPSIPCIADVSDIQFDPGAVSLGENLGERSTLTVNFMDVKHPDVGLGFDKYLSERGYDPMKRGSFWAKFRARQPYLRNRPIRWVTALISDAGVIVSSETRHFLMDSSSGPTYGGSFVIVSKDVLKLADDKRSVAPDISQGFLVAGIDSAVRTLTLSPAGIGDLEYGSSGADYALLGGSEIVMYRRDVTHGNDANTLWLVHADGVDGSTTFTDVSASALATTVGGNAQVDTAQSMFGGASMLLDGTNDYLRTPSLTTWQFPGVDFTIECFARDNIFDIARPLMGWSFNANNYWRFTINTNGSITFELVDAGVVTVTMTSATGLVTAAWRHFALVRQGTTWSIYFNGNRVATVVDASTIPVLSAQIYFGFDSQSANGFFGNIDEMRISNVARYSGATYTVPVSPFQVSGDVLDIVRAQFGTVASDHAVQDRVQKCLYFQGKTPDYIISYLLRLHANVSPAFIPDADWALEVSQFFDRLFTTIICEPTPVKDLVGEIIEQAGLAVWWNDIDQIVGLRVLRGIQPGATAYDGLTVKEGSTSIEDQPEARWSQIWVYYGILDYTKDLQEPTNYRSVELTLDLERETFWGGPVIKVIYSRWIAAFGGAIAARLGSLLLNRRRDPPRKVGFAVQRYNVDPPRLAGNYYLGAWSIQDATGAEILMPVQVTRVKPSADTFAIEAVEILGEDDIFDEFGGHTIIINTNTYNFNWRAVHDAAYNVAVSGDIVNCYINSGVIVGSTSTANPAFTVGTWNAGVILNLIVNGRIQGKGGSGKNGPGNPGGTALYTRRAINIELIAAKVWSGGGAGGRYFYPNGTDAIGGGGGAGYDPGLPGNHNGNTAASGPGTTEAGGVAPFPGGNGGGPGLPGDNATHQFSGDSAAAGGAAGVAIDGVSFLTLVNGPGDIRGSQVN